MSVRLTIEKRTILIIVFFSLMAILIVGLIIYPSIRAIKRTEQEVAQLQLFLEQRYRKVASVRVAIEKVKEIAVTVAQYPNHLFKHGDELKLITDLERLVGSAGLNQKIIRSNLDNVTDRVELTLSVTGNYAAVLAYLAQLERLPYFLTITRLSLTPVVSRANPDAVPTEANLTLDAILYAH